MRPNLRIALSGRKPRTVAFFAYAAAASCTGVGLFAMMEYHSAFGAVDIFLPDGASHQLRATGARKTASGPPARTPTLRAAEPQTAKRAGGGVRARRRRQRCRRQREESRDLRNTARDRQGHTRNGYHVSHRHTGGQRHGHRWQQAGRMADRCHA